MFEFMRVGDVNIILLSSEVDCRGFVDSLEGKFHHVRVSSPVHGVIIVTYGDDPTVKQIHPAPDPHDWVNYLKNTEKEKS